MADQDTVELTVHLVFRDYLRTTYCCLFRPIAMKLFVVFAIPQLALVVYLLASAGLVWPGIATPLLVPTALLLVVVSAYFSARRAFLTNKVLQEAIAYRFSSSGIDAVASSSSGHVEWGNISQAWETKSDFILFLSSQLVYTIPKRCFINTQQISAFRLLLWTQLGTNAKLRLA